MGDEEWKQRVLAPLDTVDKCFGAVAMKHAKCEGRSTLDAAKFALRNSDEWGLQSALGELFSREAYESIPWLSLKSLQSGAITSGSLVRYRCMVQDMFDPEYFSSLVRCAPKEKGIGGDTRLFTTKFREYFVPKAGMRVDHEAKDLDHPSLLGERLPLYCVPIPGENGWARERRLSQQREQRLPVEQTMRSSRKRVQVSHSVIDECEEHESAPSCKNRPGANPTKRRSVAREANENNMQVDNESGAQSSQAEAPKTCSPLDEVRKATPIKSDTQDVPCIVKVYDQPMGDFQLNDLVEFVGVLFLSDPNSGDPDMPNGNRDDETGIESIFESLEVSARTPPLSLVPRLHCIGYSKMPCNFVLDTRSLGTTSLPELRERSHTALARTCMGGDLLATDFLLMWLVSGVFARPDEHVLVGKFSLALTQHPGGAMATRLRRVLSLILPRNQAICLDVELLNKESINPRKCNVANRLRAGRLQTCAATPVVIDETTLGMGKLDAAGVLNVQALAMLVAKQVVSYDFQFYQKEWPVDLPTLVVSGNKKPVVQGADCCVPFQGQVPDDSICPAAAAVGDETRDLTRQELDDIRQYLEQARNQNRDAFELPDDVCEKVQSDFVEMRKRDKNVMQGDLSLILNLGRLYARSRGSSTLDMDAWNATLQLEAQRKARLPMPVATAASAPKKAK